MPRISDGRVQYESLFWSSFIVIFFLIFASAHPVPGIDMTSIDGLVLIPVRNPLAPRIPKYLLIVRR